MNLLDLAVAIKCDDQASDEIEEFSTKTKNNWSTISKAGAALATAFYAGASAIGVAALKSYASYEQLVGGIETLYQESSDALMAYASNAYATAGMSANQYMELATSFSASLLQGLGGDTAAAVEYANMAITDMSDNANKMGSDIESIQNAYQGFAKQNYTMLDNLKLGYGGTKSEMERLLRDAEALSGIHYDIENYADVVEAIHVIQTEMHISGISAEEAARAVASGAMTEEEAFEAMGTTAKEAATTIEGSLNAAKAAWSNWLVGLADSEQDISFLTNNLVKTATTALENIVPRVLQIFTTLVSSLPGIINTIVPIVVKQVMSVLPALAQLVPSFVNVALQLWSSFLSALSEVIPEIVRMIPGLVNQIVDTLVDNVPLMIDAGIELFMSLTDAFVDTLPVLIEHLPEMIDKVATALIENAPKVLAAGVQLFWALIEAIPEVVSSLVSAVGDMISRLPDKVLEFVDEMFEAGKALVQGILDGIKSMFVDMWNGAKDLADIAVTAYRQGLEINSPSKVFSRISESIPEGIADGIQKKAQLAIDSIKAVSDDIMQAGDISLQWDSNTSPYSNAAIDASHVVNNNTYIDGAMINSESQILSIIYDLLMELKLNYSNGGQYA